MMEGSKNKQRERGRGREMESNPAHLQIGCPCREPCRWFCMVLLFPTQVIHLSISKSTLGLEMLYGITIINRICCLPFNTIPRTLRCSWSCIFQLRTKCWILRGRQGFRQGTSGNEDSLHIFDLAVLLSAETALLRRLTLKTDLGNLVLSPEN